MKTASFVVLIVLLNALVGWLTNLPQDVGSDVPSGKLNSLSFAPFREGQGPMDEIFPSPEQIDADLRLMGEKTHSIRTYASAEGSMPVIPELAKKYGLKMIQGAWLGTIEADNKAEIAEVIRSANAHPDVVKRVIVGNEVLLRGDLEPEQLVEYIREVKRSVKQPVSYADVWSMYMKYPDLIKEVDFVTIHILPYWEDEPITVEQAPGHIERIFKQVQQEINAIAPGKAILIGESGWPGEGRQRGWAVPSVVNEAKFIRELIKVANKNGFDVNIVEAFNQSWKSEFEGVVGANWGLYSVDRKEVFPLTGRVYENPAWLAELIASTLLFLCVAVFFWRPLQALSPLRIALFLAFSQLLGVLLVNMAEHLWYTSYSDWQRAQTALTVGLNAVLGGLILQRGYGLLANQPTTIKLGAWLYTLYLVFAGFAVYQTVGLALHGRYISFPTVAVYIPVAGILWLSLIASINQRSWALQNSELNRLVGHLNTKAYQDKWMAYALLMAGLALLVLESYGFMGSRDFILAYPDMAKRISKAAIFSVSNGQLLAWLLCLVVLALSLLVGRNRKNI
ncbi:MAG: glycosyl hydrolase family 17 protein [Methylobacter sp.]|nr:glycosyl hydrolase family 17 protein [Methylobacter sp.]MDP2099588.1 glycosyl hydrolase family 17 protein [Methylobacter sp.]MDP2429784.1 glycosyl hydrolase family 17 protein [Methylobacter sp.]MDP3055504.1 glycosyl hydrolase family 17 protein [Methylobacter sp.]MDP3363378.1 glycosyl hydrolase family 17 protein [Methylobacter sp.]